MGRRAKGDVSGELAMAAAMAELRARRDLTGRFALYLDPGHKPRRRRERAEQGGATGGFLWLAVRWRSSMSSTEPAVAMVRSFSASVETVERERNGERE
jgi:hypothetical protein